MDPDDALGIHCTLNPAEGFSIVLCRHAATGDAVFSFAAHRSSQCLTENLFMSSIQIVSCRETPHPLLGVSSAATV